MTELSANGLKAALSGWTDEALLACLVFEHENLAEPIRLVSNTKDITRGSDTYLAFPFQERLHTKSDDGIAYASITADAVDQRIVSALRAIQGSRPTVTFDVVLASSPTEVEQGPIEYEITGFSLPGPSVIEINASFAFDFLNNAFPKDYFAPWNSGDS